MSERTCEGCGTTLDSPYAADQRATRCDDCDVAMPLEAELSALQEAHRQALAERDEARAQAAVMRRALEVINGCIGYSDTMQQWVLAGAERTRPALEQVRAALSSSAGADLLEEVEGLRRANVAMASRLAPDWSRWIGPCVHGRDPWDRCDTCEEAGEAQSIVWVLDAERKKHAAESADLRARLEAVEKERDGAVRDLDGLREAWGNERAEFVQRDAALRLAMNQGLEAGVEDVVVALAQEKMAADVNAPAAWCAAEVRRAVGAEREAIRRVILGGSFLHDQSPQAVWARQLVAAIDRDMEKRSRGGA